MLRDPRAQADEQGYVALTFRDIARNDAEEILLAEFARIIGNINRARGVALLLDQRFPGIVDELERLLDRSRQRASGSKRRPRSVGSNKKKIAQRRDEAKAGMTWRGTVGRGLARRGWAWRGVVGLGRHGTVGRGEEG